MDLCEARVRHECELDIHEVLQGLVVFRPELIPVCLDAISPILEVCQSKPTETKAILQAEAPCRQIFEGATAVGDGCLVSGECAQLPVPSLGVVCDDELGVCVERRIATVFDGCGDTLSHDGRELCAQGLYCQPAPWAPDFRLCSEAIRLSYPCVLSGPQYVPCELGTYCGGGPLSCQPSQADGTACSSDAQCLSHRCPFGLCAPALTPVTDKECGVPCSDSSCP